ALPIYFYFVNINLVCSIHKCLPILNEKMHLLWKAAPPYIPLNHPNDSTLHPPNVISRFLVSFLSEQKSALQAPTLLLLLLIILVQELLQSFPLLQSALHELFSP